MTSEVGSKIRRINKTEAIVGTKTRTGDRTRSLPSIILPRLPRLMRTSQYQWTLTALEPHQEEDVP